MEVFIAVLVIVVFFYFLFSSKPKWHLPKKPFPTNWRKILIDEIQFYNTLTSEEKKKFEYQVQEFLLNCRITPIKTEIDDTDRILVASSAVIPIFGFDNWKYTNLKEVLIYPGMFNQDFETDSDDKNILGMVGTGYMNEKMILSKHALRHGFKNETDKKNTAIHEFVHLIDKADGFIDGIPSLLLERQYTIPWLDLINQKMEEINKGDSDINPYGGTSRVEFFTVASEYFFERPKLLEKNHPKLYSALEKVFNQKMSNKKLRRTGGKIGKNSKCPCGSNQKFKKCCGRSHYSR
jgi:hypothetical protein